MSGGGRVVEGASVGGWRLRPVARAACAGGGARAPRPSNPPPPPRLTPFLRPPPKQTNPQTKRTGNVVRAPSGVMHGKASPVHHTGVGLLEGLEK